MANDTIKITINYVGLDGEVHRGTTKRDMYIGPGFRNPENGEYYGEEFLRNGKKKIRIISKQDFLASRGERPGLRDKKPTTRANRKVRKNTSSPVLIPACCFIFFMGLLLFLVDPRTVDTRLSVAIMITGPVLLILAILQKIKEKKSALQTDRKKVSRLKVQVESSNDIGQKQSTNWDDHKSGSLDLSLGEIVGWIIRKESGGLGFSSGGLLLFVILGIIIPAGIMVELTENKTSSLLVEILKYTLFLLPTIIVFYKTEDFFAALKWAAGTLVSLLLFSNIAAAIFGWKGVAVLLVLFYVPAILSLLAFFKYSLNGASSS